MTGTFNPNTTRESTSLSNRTASDGGTARSYMRALRKRPAVIGLSRRERSFEQLEATLGDFLGAMIAMMILFAGAIAFGSVLNTALVSLSERRREVGTLRVLGYTTGQTARIFTGESLILNGIGLALGIVAGIGLSHAMAAAFDLEVYRFPVVIRPVTVFIAEGLGARVALCGRSANIRDRPLPWLYDFTITGLDAL